VILATCTRIDTDLTFRLEEALVDSMEWMHLRRHWVIVVAIVASVLDLLLTQSILTIVGGLVNDPGRAEQNPLMAAVIMTWWAWPLRVGVPVVALLHDLKVKNYGVITAAAGMYACVVIWNTHILYSLRGLT
jgi:hypothetical protein